MIPAKVYDRSAGMALLAAACMLLCAASVPSLPAATFSNPVLAGDYPDPTIIRVGDEYWATATSSEWAPLFPLLRSVDLVNWEHVGNVFERRPDWASGNFWAPELFEHKGRFFIYYTARQRGGPLSVAVATADHPRGPWKDHGPMIGQEVGSIDAFAVTNLTGELFLMWKEDGNSRNKPTPLWIQKLSPDGTKLVGEMKEILRNEVEWERNLVEGPYVMRRGEYWYLFYSAAGCCGRGCTYTLGVARARDLLGPWERYSRNPILESTERWKCPGHGTIVTDKSGRDWLLYHAYDASTFIYVGRQGLLDEVTWGADGWPAINAGQGPSTTLPVPRSGIVQRPAVQFVDDFSGVGLGPEWQWPQNNEPRRQIKDGKLVLAAGGARDDQFVAGVLGLKTTTGDYAATTTLDIRTLQQGTGAGLSAFGDSDNALGVTVRDGKAHLWRRQRNRHQVLSTNTVPSAEVLHLRMTASAGHKFSFSFSADGRNWTPAGDNIDLEGNYLPPWDRGIRVALIVGGPDATATFDDVRVAPNHQP